MGGPGLGATRLSASRSPGGTAGRCGAPLGDGRDGKSPADRGEPRVAGTCVMPRSRRARSVTRRASGRGAPVRPSRLPPHADSAVPLRPPRPAQEPDGPTSPRRQLTGNSRKSRWTRAPPAPRPCARTEVTGASTDGGTTSAPHAPRTSARPQRHATTQGRDRLACAPLLSERRGFSPEPDAAPPAPRTKRPPTGVLRAALAGANSRGRLRRGPRYISDVSHGSGEFLPARTRK